MSTIKNGGLDQYGAKPFERQQFGTADVEGVKLQPASGKRHKNCQQPVLYFQVLRFSAPPHVGLRLYLTVECAAIWPNKECMQTYVYRASIVCLGTQYAELYKSTEDWNRRFTMSETAESCCCSIILDAGESCGTHIVVAYEK